MKVQTKYRVHNHYKFEHGGRRYAADLESGAIIEINEVEWELLNRDLAEKFYAIVEALRSQFKNEQIFEGIERLQRLSRYGYLLTPTKEARTYPQSGEKLKLLVPFEFVEEKKKLDAVTNENRYHLLESLSKHAELETISIGGKSVVDFGEFVSVRSIDRTDTDARYPYPWYAGNDYDGILLLSQNLWQDILYYLQDIPIFRCIESDRKLQDTGLEKALEHSTVQKPTDMLLPKASWLVDWLSGFGVNSAGMHMISEGINVVEPVGKALAKQHVASLTGNSLFGTRSMVGFISGLKPHMSVQVVFELANANPDLVFFVYDSVLAEWNQKTQNNVVIFGVDDEETRAVLPIFFQALDLVCFPAIPGTSPSLVLEAMAYGTPAVAISKYGLPPEIENAGVLVQCQSRPGMDLVVPIPQVSETIKQLLKDSKRREKYGQIAKGFATKYTWEHAAQKIVSLFQQSTARANAHRRLPASFSPLFCRHYDPRTGTAYSVAYRRSTERFEHLEDALAEVLSKYHTPAEVKVVFEHFQRRKQPRVGNGLNSSG